MFCQNLIGTETGKVTLLPRHGEVAQRRLIAIDPETAELEIIAENLPIGMPPIMGPPKTFLPTGVLVGRGGIIYVTTDIGHNVLKITPTH